MNPKVKKLLLFLLAGMFLASCSKKSPTEPANSEPTQLEIKKIEVPSGMKSSADPKAIQTVSLLNFVDTYKGLFQIPQTAVGDNGKFTWTRGNLSATMFQGNTDGKISWKLVLNGTENGKTYNNWVALQAGQSTDQKSGWMKIYKENSTEVASKWTWTTDANGKYTFTMVSNNTSVINKIEIISNPDHSGELDQYTNNILTAKTIWDKDGNGQWWEYDEQGNITNSGSWKASS